MTKIKDRMLGVMEDVFQIGKADITDQSSPESIKEWDSLKHMLLLMALEEEFEFRFTDNEMAQCLSVESIMEVLSNKK